MYKTTLEKRTHDIGRKDFMELGDLSVDNGKRDEMMNSSLHAWNEHIPYTPTQFYETLTAGIPEAMSMVISLAEYGLIGVRTMGASMGSFLQYRIRPNSIDLIDSVVRVNNAYQGQGLGKIWIRNAMEMTAAMGINDFRFKATNDNGAYSWARMGAYLDIQSREFQKAQVNSSTVYLGRLAAVEDYLSPKTYHEAKALCRMIARDDLVRLARMDDVMLPMHLCPGSGDVSKANVIREKLLEFYSTYQVHGERPNVSANGETFRVRAAFNTAARFEKPALSLPRYLLSESYWPGIVDFTDDAQMEKVGKYVGGWKTIVPSVSQTHPALTAEYA